MKGDARASIGTTICGRKSILAWRAQVFFLSFVLFSLTLTYQKYQNQTSSLVFFSFLSLPSTKSWFCFVLIVCTLAPSFVPAALKAWNIVVLHLWEAVKYYFSKRVQSSPKVIQKMGNDKKHLKYVFEPLQDTFGQFSTTLEDFGKNGLRVRSASSLVLSSLLSLPSTLHLPATMLSLKNQNVT